MSSEQRRLAGRYVLEAPIGRGGMGEVWRATDTVLGRQVAVKTIDLATLRDESGAARFEREARATAGLSHPNVVTVHDSGVEGDTAYIVMELLPGPSLADELAERAAAGRRGRRGGPPGGVGARRRPRPRARAPRHQAGQHRVRRRRPGPGARLRHHPALRAHRLAGAHRDAHRHGHRRVPRPRAGPRRPGRRSRRPLRPGLRALRPARRASRRSRAPPRWPR